jgi:hypothetical protein
MVQWLAYQPIRKVPGLIPTVVTNNTGEKIVGIMTTNHLKMGVELSPETSFISNMPQTMGSVQHSVSITNDSQNNHSKSSNYSDEKQLINIISISGSVG